MVQIELVDTHCHLAMDVFCQDLDQIVENARRAGVTRILVPGTDIESSFLAIQLSERYPEVYAAVGVHPHAAASWTAGSMQALRSLASKPKVVAIGEIGLDFYRDFSPRPAQIACFQMQLDLAAEIELPIIVHNREAIEDVLGILLPWVKSLSGSRSEFPGVLHAYAADEASAQLAMDQGFYLGIAGPITFKNAEQLRSLVYNLPIERLLIETDSPYLSPDPKRGKRNEPANVQWIMEKLASVKERDIESVARITTSNAEAIFHWTGSPSDSNLL
ncbi:MAG: TatD family deoxyribonuclease [Anaerolineales bacterium]|nr:MAG: TatD family deoxyribonuclease [Anaerolineales bacterium]